MTTLEHFQESPATTVRPSWVKGKLSEEYFVQEWGKVPLTQEALFEHLCLLVFQTGLTWETVLKYRAGLKSLFFDYRVQAIAEAPDDYFLQAVEENTDIIRNLRKIEACRNNAQCLIDYSFDLPTLLVEEYPVPLLVQGTFDDLPHVTSRTKIITTTLKEMGFGFIGATTIGSLVQATGLIQLEH